MPTCMLMLIVFGFKIYVGGDSWSLLQDMNLRVHVRCLLGDFIIGY